jgi:hypothetical protein
LYKLIEAKSLSVRRWQTMWSDSSVAVCGRSFDGGGGWKDEANRSGLDPSVEEASGRMRRAKVGRSVGHRGGWKDEADKDGLDMSVAIRVCLFGQMERREEVREG